MTVQLRPCQGRLTQRLVFVDSVAAEAVSDSVTRTAIARPEFNLGVGTSFFDHEVLVEGWSIENQEGIFGVAFADLQRSALSGVSPVHPR